MERSDAPFFLLCSQDRQGMYLPVVQALPHRVELFGDPDLLLAACLASPPTALLVDVLSVAKIGYDRAEAVTGLAVSWPILRCNINAQGQSAVMSQELQRRAALRETLDALSAGDRSWDHPRHRRKYLRLETSLRVRLHLPGEPLRQTNALDISVGGLFVVAYEPIRSTQLELDLLDLTDSPLRLRCTAVQQRTWEQGPSLPGVGLRIEGGDLDAYRQKLYDPSLIARFRSHIH